MSRKNERLLGRCIPHWLRMRDDPDCEEEPNGRHCPLCKEYVRGPGSKDNCLRCPIAQYTGEDSCALTPYGDAYGAYWDWQAAVAACADGKRREWRKAATAELRFLRKVLAAEKRKTAKRKGKT